MSGEHLKAQARRVVSGFDEQGKSTIVDDGLTPTRLAGPGFTVMDLWRVDHLPTTVDAADASGPLPVIDPPPGGLVVRIASLPPDSEIDAADYAASLDAFGGADAHDGGATDQGVWHSTDTVDVVILLSGELYAVTETAETLLRPGDSFVTRGINHIWSNRTDQPAVIVAVMMGAQR